MRLTDGAACLACLAAVLMDSKHQGNVRIETPQLEIAYPTPTTEPIRPRNPRPTGASTVASAEFLSDFVSLLRTAFQLCPLPLRDSVPALPLRKDLPALLLRKLVQVSEVRLGVQAPQYSHGDFPEYLKRPQPFKDVPRL